MTITNDVLDKSNFDLGQESNFDWNCPNNMKS